MLGIAGPLHAQFNNEWIEDYGQTYLKMKVGKTGIYRIPYGVLSARIPNLSSLDAADFQVFARGQEQHIYVQGESSGTFHSGQGYIEFFAEHNDGSLDTPLYEDPSDQPHPHYSLFNDTITYYLTWNDNAGHLRMAEVAYSSPPGTPVNFLQQDLVVFRGDRYNPGPLDGAGKSQADYAEGEGWFTNIFGISGQSPNGGSRAFRAYHPNLFTSSGAPPVTGKAVFVGVSNPPVPNPNHKMAINYRNAANTGTGTNIGVVTYNAYQLQQFTFTLASSSMGSDSTDFIFSVTPQLWQGTATPTTDQSVVSNVQLTVAVQPDLDGATSAEFTMPAGSNFLDIANFVSDANAFVYDLTGHNRIAVESGLAANGQIRANVPNSSQQRRLFLTSTFSSVITNLGVAEVEPVGSIGRFVDYSQAANQGDYLILTHPNLKTAANQYASYRSTTGYSPLVVEVNELYDQFGFGVPGHPMALRNFSDYALQQWTEDPEFLFLLGKSVAEPVYRNDGEAYTANLVPTMGSPASDNMITAGLNNTLYDAAIPTGRLSAKNATEVTDYLDKVIEFENTANLPNTIEDRLWMKQALHFGGGANEFEQGKFRGYLETYTGILGDTAFGGQVTPFYKQTSNPIQFEVSDSIITMLQSGVSLMTFFGHAGGGSFDISIDDPSDWNNKQRYPLVLANSCFTGDIHQKPGPVLSTSEEYVLIPDEGAIAYIASVDLGYEDLLNLFSDRFYRQLSVHGYGLPLSHILRNAVQSAQSPGDIRLETTLLEMTLHGDPALRLHPHAQPDLAISEKHTRFVPAIVNTERDSFDLEIDLYNIGRGVQKDILVEVTRTFPDGSTTVYNQSIVGVPFLEKVVFRLPVDPVNGVGDNGFSILVDALDSVRNEADEIFNNRLNLNLNITSNDLFPIFPPNYAVMAQPDVTLKAFTGDPFSAPANYEFQLDTTDLYNSPALQTTTLTNQPGGVLTWTPDLTAATDSMVYFWRVTPTDTTNGEKWQEHSFQYIDGKEGWGQDHFFQFKKDDFRFVEYNRSTRQFALKDEARKLDVQVLGNPQNNDERLITSYRLDGVEKESSICTVDPDFQIVVIDSASLEPWATRAYVRDGQGNIVDTLNPQNGFGNQNDLDGCRTRAERFFSYRVENIESMDSMISLMNNHVENGHYILAYSSRGQFGTTNWEERHYQAFEALGATNIRTVDADVPYIFVARKGHPNTAEEVWGSDPREFLKLTTSLENLANEGAITSTRIGPAQNWGSLHWRQQSLEQPVVDSVLLTLHGIDLNEQVTELGTFSRNETSVLDLGTIVDAQQYPYLELEFFGTDPLLETFPYLDRWHVLYERAPEVAINPTKGYVFKSNTINQGEELRMALAVENIGDKDFGPVRVKYTIRDNNGTEYSIPYADQDSLAPGDVLFDTISFDSRFLAGPHTLFMEVNPQDSLWVREQFHFNNLAFRSFTVNRDRTNPLLDVTFDGIHILDGDLVSANPAIAIRLKDENPYLLVNDTSLFDVYITPPNRNERRVPFVEQGQEIIRFQPAVNGKNTARLDLMPTLPVDGTYRLRVQARDVSGNNSGPTDYVIHFEVVNRTAISNLLNYPNPFTTSTRFVFTLTGSTVPDQMKIQIMTVTGKVVREITQDELGPLRIGNNMTEYAWDGTDEYGDRLANGVYLYRVVTKMNGEHVEHLSTSTDKFFHRGFGKMYLMR